MWPVLQEENAVDALIRIAKEHMSAKDIDLARVANHHQQTAETLLVKAKSKADKQEYLLADILSQSIYDEQQRTENARNAQTFCVDGACGPALEIVALGPLTNLAIACRMFPVFPACVRQLYVMGGTSRGRGNVPGFASGEFNCHADPDAMEIIVQSFYSPILVTWECCEDHSLQWDEVLTWRQSGTTKGKFLQNTGHSIVQVSDQEQNQKLMMFCQKCLEAGWLYTPCDPLCAAVALYPSLLVGEAGVEHRYCRIQRSQGPAQYQSVVDRDGLTGCAANSWLVTHIDKDNLRKVLQTMVEDKASI